MGLVPGRLACLPATKAPRVEVKLARMYFLRPGGLFFY